jgi:predicted PurR-regulated permease PerM
LASRDSELPSLQTLPVAPGTKRGRRIALAVLMLLAFLMVAYIAAPLWVGLVLGTVMAFTAQPLYRRLTAALGERRSLAAAFTTIIGGIVTAAGATAAGWILTREAINIVGLVQKRVASGSFSDALGEKGNRVLQSLGIDRNAFATKLESEVSKLAGHAAEAAGVIVQATTSALLTLIIALWTMYYVLLEWPKIALRLERLLPLDPRHTRALVLEFRDVGRSAFIGTIATAIVQGIFAGVGFAVAGIPHPVTWGIVTAIASFLPVIGTGLVWVPMGIYCIMNGRLWWGVFVFAWGALVVMAVSDYVVRPRLVGSKGQGHPLLMLIALLGGIEVFGLAGLIVGPVLMSLFLAIVRIYEREAIADALERPTVESASD